MKVLVLGLIATVACSSACSSSNGELRVDLRTDLTPVAEFDRVIVEVFDVDVREMAVVAGADFVQGERVGSFELGRGPHRGRVLLLNNGEPYVERTFSVNVAKRTGMTMVLTRNCAGVVCGDPVAPACLDGMCVSEECSVERPDLCPAPECTSDAECSEAGSDCARNACLSGVCVLVDSGSCGPTQYCDVVNGCRNVEPVASDAGSDGGAPDSGVDAGVDTGMPTADACAPGVPGITITAPTVGSGTRTSSEEPLTVRWMATGVTGDVRVEVVGDLNDVDQTVAACAGSFVTPPLTDCTCLVRVSSVDDPAIEDSLMFEVFID